MTYQVLARKWRPQDFTDMVGQDHISSTLCNAIKNDRVGHAYLFVGTRGTGKTTTARIFAKAINCEKPTEDANPCNECTNCKEITAGSSMDVLEIDGASNNGVDDIRRLRDNVQYSPARCQYKVYIIDEVHMLSTAAWNALLKTLEEPPEHVKFLFATTEVHKVLPTILSRCQRFDLKRISQGTIARRLQEVAQQENAKFDLSALNSIARAANGGMRDALSIMDQMIAFCSEQDVISEHDVSEVFGLTSVQDLGKIMSAMLSDNAKQLITEINRLSDMGRNLEQLYSDLLKFCRNLMICAISGENASDILDLDEYDLQMAQSIVQQSSADTIQKLMDGFLNYDGKLRNTLNKRVFMEMTLVRIMKDAHAVSLNDILARINHLRKTGSLQGLEGDFQESTKQIELPEPQKKNDIAPAPAVEETPKAEEQAPAENETEAPPEPEVAENTAPNIEETPAVEETPVSQLDTVEEVISETEASESTAPIEETLPEPEAVEPTKEEPKQAIVKEDPNAIKLEDFPIPVAEEIVPEELDDTPAQQESSPSTINEVAPSSVTETTPSAVTETVPSSEIVEKVPIDDSYELSYSTFIDAEYIDSARQKDPLNIGVKKLQGSFDENNETPGANLGLYQTVNRASTSKNQETPTTQESNSSEPQAVEEITEPVIEETPVEETIQEPPSPETTPELKVEAEVQEEKEEYVPQQAPTEESTPPQTAQDTHETISKQVFSKEAEITPESEAESFWKKLVSNSQTTQLRAILQNINPVSYQDNRFYAAYETGQAEFDDGAKQLLEGELRKVTGNASLELALVGASKDVVDDKPVLTSGEDVWDRVKANPLFSNICKEFDGKIIDVRG